MILYFPDIFDGSYIQSGKRNHQSEASSDRQWCLICNVVSLDAFSPYIQREILLGNWPTATPKSPIAQLVRALH